MKGKRGREDETESTEPVQNPKEVCEDCDDPPPNNAKCEGLARFEALPMLKSPEELIDEQLGLATERDCLSGKYLKTLFECHIYGPAGRPGMITFTQYDQFDFPEEIPHCSKIGARLHVVHDCEDRTVARTLTLNSVCDNHSNRDEISKYVLEFERFNSFRHYK